MLLYDCRPRAVNDFKLSVGKAGEGGDGERREVTLGMARGAGWGRPISGIGAGSVRFGLDRP